MKNFKNNVKALSRAFASKHGVAGNTIIINQFNLGDVWHLLDFSNSARNPKFDDKKIMLSDSIADGNIKITLI